MPFAVDQMLKSDFQRFGREERDARRKRRKIESQLAAFPVDLARILATRPVRTDDERAKPFFNANRAVVRVPFVPR